MVLGVVILLSVISAKNNPTILWWSAKSLYDRNI